MKGGKGKRKTLARIVAALTLAGSNFTTAG